MRYSAKLVLYQKEKFFGPGVAALLELIDETQSIRSACQQMSLAYTKALKIIRAAESGFGFTLLVRQTGGKSGGGSALTDKARQALALYRVFESDVKAYADSRFDVLKASLADLAADQ